MGPYSQRGKIPEQETRGGNRVNWAEAKPGEALPELPADAYPEPDSEQLPLWEDTVKDFMDQNDELLGKLDD